MTEAQAVMLFYAMGLLFAVMTIRTKWWRELREESARHQDDPTAWFVLSLVALGWPLVYGIIGVRRFVDWYSLPLDDRDSL